MKQVILYLVVISFFLVAPVKAQMLNGLWVRCTQDNRLFVAFPPRYHRNAMTELKELSFIYGEQRLVVYTQPAFDRCHVPGHCRSHVVLPYQEGTWRVVIDGMAVGTVVYDWRFDGDTRSHVESCAFNED